MKIVLKLEELAMFALGIFVFSKLNYAWWWFPLLLLATDISALGYLFGNNAGAFTYNLFHHKGTALFVFVLGFVYGNPLLQLIGTILWSHSCMDRIFGYGLKYEKGFKFTHLGSLGKQS